MRYKPMLAYPVSKKPIDYNKPVFIQPKLDGVRCLIQYDNSKVTAYSRTGKEWKNIDHILENLAPWFKNNSTTVLDGELYNHDLRNNFEKIISLVRKTKPTDKDRLEARKYTQFHCYDIIDEKIPYDQRNEFINQSLMLLGDSIYIVDTRFTPDDHDAKLSHGINLADGYEGSIVRTNNVYQNKRSHSLRKFKDFHDAEAQIIGYETGAGKREGTLGKFIMQDDNGIQFGCPPGKGFTYKDMADMLNNINDYIGETATFTYFERTKAGSYRHPLFKCIRNYE